MKVAMLYRNHPQPLNRLQQKLCGLFLSLLLLTALHQTVLAAPSALLETGVAVEVPILVAPADSAVTTGGETAQGASSAPLGIPTFRWEPLPDAPQYQVEVSASPGFSTFIVKKLTFATTYTPELAFSDGDY